MINVRQRVQESLESLGPKELCKIYDYIEALKRMTPKPSGRKAPSIDRIHEMTGMSRASWADAVLEDREDRL